MNVNAININRCSNISKLTTTNCLCMSFSVYVYNDQVVHQNIFGTDAIVGAECRSSTNFPRELHQFKLFKNHLKEHFHSWNCETWKTFQTLLMLLVLRWLPLVSVFTHYFIRLLSNVVHSFKTVVRWILIIPNYSRTIAYIKYISKSLTVCCCYGNNDVRTLVYFRQRLYY